jgi:hypothetical protein
MKKYFQSYIKQYQIFPKRSIYGAHSKNLISEFNRHEATLYFIVKTKKVVFLPESFRPIGNYCFLGFLEVSGRRHEIVFNTAKMHYDHKEINKRFSSIEDFCNFSMRDWGVDNYPNLSNAEKYAAIAHVDLHKSSANEIVINCPLGKAITGATTEIIVTPYQLIMFFDIDCLSEIEILYIGKSNDDTWKRIYNHNKWGLIDENISPDEEVIVYFLQLDKSDMDIGSIGSNFVLIHRQESEVTIENATLSIEAALISYFIETKKFNDHHVGKGIGKIDLIQDKLKKRGYTNLIVEVALDGLFGFVGTSKSGFRNYHKIETAL